jgi:hypothetical protein
LFWTQNTMFRAQNDVFWAQNNVRATRSAVQGGIDLLAGPLVGQRPSHQVVHIQFGGDIPQVCRQGETCGQTRRTPWHCAVLPLCTDSCAIRSSSARETRRSIFETEAVSRGFRNETPRRSSGATPPVFNGLEHSSRSARALLKRGSVFWKGA